jgi:N-acetylglucosamine kinase-like BadF-type ATPase
VNDDVLVVGVDGGNSKTHAVAVRPDGSVAGWATGGTSSVHLIGLAEAADVVNELVLRAAAGSPVAQANIYLAGLDLVREVASYRQAIRARDWSSETTVVDNDIFALLRLGTGSNDAVAVVCGAGMNGVGIRGDGAVARFFALGALSGDWGGGQQIGELALWHASRSADRRGPRTALEELLPEHFGLGSVANLIEAVHEGHVSSGELAHVTPLVLRAAESDDVAASIVDRQSAEIALMAASCIERLALGERQVPVILGGGVVRSRNARLIRGVGERLATLAPNARLEVVDESPIVGATLLALESAGVGGEALDRARVEVAARAAVSH